MRSVKKQGEFSNLQATYIRLSTLFFELLSLVHTSTIMLKLSAIFILSLVLTDTKIRGVLVCLAICYGQNESVSRNAASSDTNRFL